jgi:hypothetical protein
MKTATILSCIFFGIVFTSLEMSSQNKKSSDVVISYDYKNAVGIRAGRTAGITYKHFFNTAQAFEGIIGFWPNAVGITALYEKHMGVGLNGLRFYYGAGGHFTGETGHYYYRKYNDRDGDYIPRYGRNGFAVGLDGITGLEYKIGMIPLALSFDLKPFVEVSNYGIIYTALDIGLSVKLAF